MTSAAILAIRLPSACDSVTAIISQWSKWSMERRWKPVGPFAPTAGPKSFSAVKSARLSHKTANVTPRLIRPFCTVSSWWPIAPAMVEMRSDFQPLTSSVIRPCALATSSRPRTGCSLTRAELQLMRPSRPSTRLHFLSIYGLYLHSRGIRRAWRLLTMSRAQ